MCMARQEADGSTIVFNYISVLRTVYTPSPCVLSPCLDGSGLFWQHEVNLQSIRQVVLMV